MQSSSASRSAVLWKRWEKPAKSPPAPCALEIRIRRTPHLLQHRANIPHDAPPPPIRERGGDQAGYFLIQRIVVTPHELQRVGGDRRHVERGHELVEALAEHRLPQRARPHGVSAISSPFSSIQRTFFGCTPTSLFTSGEGGR